MRIIALPAILLSLCGCASFGDMAFGQQLSVEEKPLTEAEWVDETSASWECGGTAFSYNVEKLILTKGNQLGDEGFGSVTFDDNTIPTMFRLDGLERNWTWIVERDQEYVYMITLTPDNIARYYDFSGEESATASQAWSCSKQ